MAEPDMQFRYVVLKSRNCSCIVILYNSYWHVTSIMQRKRNALKNDATVVKLSVVLISRTHGRAAAASITGQWHSMTFSVATRPYLGWCIKFTLDRSTYNFHNRTRTSESTTTVSVYRHRTTKVFHKIRDCIPLQPLQSQSLLSSSLRNEPNK